MAKVTYIKGKEPHERERRLIFRNIDRKGWNPSIRKYLAEAMEGINAELTFLERKAIVGGKLDVVGCVTRA